MSKKKNLVNQAKNVVTKQMNVEITPQQKSIDELAVVSDDELYAHLDELFTTIKELRNQQSVTAFEHEISYVQRELQIRSARRRAHDLFVESEYEEPEDEEQYPEAELDNIDFVNLARRIESVRERSNNRLRRMQNVTVLS